MLVAIFHTSLVCVACHSQHTTHQTYSTERKKTQNIVIADKGSQITKWIRFLINLSYLAFYRNCSCKCFDTIKLHWPSYYGLKWYRIDFDWLMWKMCMCFYDWVFTAHPRFAVIGSKVLGHVLWHRDTRWVWTPKERLNLRCIAMMQFIQARQRPLWLT